MGYPLSIGLPLLITLTLQGLLWAGAIWHIEWLNRLALMGIAIYLILSLIEWLLLRRWHGEQAR